jgi:error-prone DNA polymerase
MQYAELHCHSAFSLLDGASNPEELAARAAELGLAALALTDHDDLGGIVRFSQAAKEVSLQPIIGAELTLQDDSHLTLLVESEAGYKNLCHLITLARKSNARGRPHIEYESLLNHAPGLVALSGCPHGAIPTSLAREQHQAAERYTKLLLEAFQDRFYLELWDHHIAQEAVIARQLLELSASYAIPWVVTNNVHYATQRKRVVHDVLTCLRHEVTLATAGRRLRPNGSWYLKSPEEMTHQWRHNLEGIKNTLVVAERCQFRLGLLKPSLPVFQLHNAPADTHNGLLEQLVWEGAARRYPQMSEKHFRQLNHELSLITKLDLAPYFLIMWDIVRFAQSQGIAVQGRGSAANSAVCYCLAITAVDPVAMDLLFERFLSEGRNEPPDIDLDIAHQEREKVIQYVYEKYGRDHAAMVCEAITYRGRSAVRDAARVLGFSAEQATQLAAEGQFREALEAAQALAAGGAAAAGFDPQDRRLQLLIQVVSGLDSLPRHRSIHVGGFVLSGEPLGQFVPIEPAAMGGRTVIQWDKDDLGPIGMIKIDLLGLGMLTMIQEALKLVKQHRGLEIDLARLDMNDPAIYDMLCEADTVGLFQVESRAQMNILPKLRPRCFYDIIVSIALVRPGPIQGNIVHPYMRRRSGKEAITYLHPTLEPILARTLGVPLFQEQGMRLAVTAAGFSPTEADQLRRVMSHKRSKEKMALLCQKLAKGMAAKGFSEDAIKTITHQLQAFANYGFPESHAASFALLVYASAYLKRYFAPEFYCAILNAQPMGFYSPATLVRDALRHGVKVRSVDLSKSNWDCTLESAAEQHEPDVKSTYSAAADSEEESAAKRRLRAQGERHEPGALKLRLGLRYVQGLGKKAKQSLESAWSTGGPFTSVEDVCLRSGLNRKALQILARAGAFESFLPGRRLALWEILAQARNNQDLPLLKALATLQSTSADEANQTHNHHGEQSNHATAAPGAGPTDRLNLPPLTPLEETVADYSTLGLSADKHPMTFYRDWATTRGIISCSELSKRIDGEHITVAGGVICRQRPATAKGFVFLTLEDETGMANVVIRPQLFESRKRVILNSDFMSITGKLQLDEGVVNVIAEDATTLASLSGQPSLPARDFH